MLKWLRGTLGKYTEGWRFFLENNSKETFPKTVYLDRTGHHVDSKIAYQKLTRCYDHDHHLLKTHLNIRFSLNTDW